MLRLAVAALGCASAVAACAGPGERCSVGGYCRVLDLALMCQKEALPSCRDVSQPGDPRSDDAAAGSWHVVPGATLVIPVASVRPEIVMRPVLHVTVTDETQTFRIVPTAVAIDGAPVDCVEHASADVPHVDDVTCPMPLDATEIALTISPGSKPPNSIGFGLSVHASLDETTCTGVVCLE